ncbi:hypothetical protein [Streptomyces purpureus]|uniref:Uncharacterized protein n=1 Tax=Streptomyces purpureus TaxID=1951 RepID=A0A918GWD6_9ACTN|nr:hypothetical protein [Streptomyces purpureus]GGT13527.1 hypothetical protein GCM10014713_02600 [Streptomyces purpureus]
MPLVSSRPATARRARLQDVNAIVRLLSGGRRQFAEEAQPELRLTLAHFGLETGEVWVTESPAGTLEAAAVWLPPGAVIDEGEYRALLRLHEIGPSERTPATHHPVRLQPDDDHWLLAALGTTADGGPEAAGAVLAPVLGLIDEAMEPAYASRPASFQARLLSRWGFVPWSDGRPGLLRREPVVRDAAV